VIYAGYRGVSLLVGAPALTVARLHVRGNARLSTGEVLAIVGALRGQSILRVDLPAYRERLLGSPWVHDASLRRVLPSTIEVTVVERVPMGLGRIGGRLYLIDPHGTLIDEYGPQHAEFDLPIIDGLAASRDSSAIDPRRVALAARLLASLAPRADLSDRISQVDVTDPHDAVVMLEDDTARIHLGEERLAERIASYVELARALRARVPEIDYVDLRFGERVYVRPSAGAQAARPAVRRQ